MSTSLPYPKALFQQHFPCLSDKQHAQLCQMGALYPFWNERLNLISRKDLPQLYVHHVLHSLAIAKVIQWNKGAQVMDLGTGGGFPGIPLAVLFPDTRFHLIDSIQKKTKAVRAIAYDLGLKNIEITWGRAEEEKGTYDFVVSRAVTRLETLCQWLKGRLSTQHQHEVPNGLFYLTGGDLASSLPSKDWSHKTYWLKDYFETPFFTSKKLVYIAL